MQLCQLDDTVISARELPFELFEVAVLAEVRLFYEVTPQSGGTIIGPDRNTRANAESSWTKPCSMTTPIAS